MNTVHAIDLAQEALYAITSQEAAQPQGSEKRKNLGNIAQFYIKIIKELKEKAKGRQA